ncbi:MAG: thiamine pyrophosphate-dependent enzyme [Bryobacteraceae bacterium]
MIDPVVVPSLGATGADVVLVEWLAQPQQWIQKGQPLFVLQTDKADMEVEAFRGGYLREILVAPGSTVSVGQMVARLADSVDEPLAVGAVHGAAADAAVAEAHSNAAYQSLESVEGLLEAYRRMVLIRRFEDHLYDLFLQGLVPGTLHQCQGQEAVAVGVCSALEPDDAIFSTHRPVGHFIARGCPLGSIAAELWGKASGCAGGKGGQMHLTDLKIGAYPSNAIVGANIPIATGAALAFRLTKTHRVAVSFFGDGATNIGAFHEGINLAAVKNAPVLFVCENNQYAASTHISLSTRVSRISERARAYGIPGYTVDGMDLLAVHRSTQQAVERARAGEGPTLLEFLTYRYAGHSRGDPGGYRTKEELQLWRAQDPIPRCSRTLIEQHGASEGQLQRINHECQEMVEQAVEFARAEPYPSPDQLLVAIYASGGSA